MRARQWTTAAAFRGTIALAILLVLCLLATPVGLRAKTESKLVRIAWIAPGPVASAIEAFRQGLRDLGYVEGRDVVVDERYPGTLDDALRERARELEERKVLQTGAFDSLRIPPVHDPDLLIRNTRALLQAATEYLLRWLRSSRGTDP